LKSHSSALTTSLVKQHKKKEFVMKANVAIPEKLEAINQYFIKDSFEIQYAV